MRKNIRVFHPTTYKTEFLALKKKKTNRYEYTSTNSE